MSLSDIDLQEKYERDMNMAIKRVELGLDKPTFLETMKPQGSLTTGKKESHNNQM